MWGVPKSVVLMAVVMALAAPARGDKIVLKNGRQIVAYHVVEDGDRVRYETSAGELSIPKSIVDHVEKSGLMPMKESPAEAAANIPAPAMEVTGNGSEIDQAAVHDGTIDQDYIWRLDVEARKGGKPSKERAALAHHAAAQFELSQGDLERALSDERTALNYAPDQPVLMVDVAYLYLKKSEFKQAIDYLERAKQAAPNSAAVYKLEGWAYYGMNRPEQAVTEWQRAMELHPDADTRAALEKAQKDKEEEENYRENESAHFQLKYNGTAEPKLALEVLHTLEEHYLQIASELNYTPPEPIGVVLYTQQGFMDITQAPGWVGALNDGRIRVPVQGLTEVNSELSRVLRHELTHSFIQQKTHGRAAIWVQEGVAQWIEGKRSDENAGVLVQVYEQGQAAPLGKLEGSWMSLPNDIAHYAYAWALANVEYIVETQGMGDVERILERVASGESTEQALEEVLRDDYGELMRSTAEYLRKSYGK
jgi:tetratricopeptide (TPR) repeat protein